MTIVVQHAISNPEKFWEILSQNPSMPEGFKVRSVLPSTDGTNAVCIWKAPSLQQLEELINKTVGDYSHNTLMPVNEDRAMGMPH